MTVVLHIEDSDKWSIAEIQHLHTFHDGNSPSLSSDADMITIFERIYQDYLDYHKRS